MKVVRYTFDVCLRDSADKDTYGMASELEKAIAGCRNVCGCETFWGDKRGYSSVDVSGAIQWQRNNGKWINGDGSVK